MEAALLMEGSDGMVPLPALSKRQLFKSFDIEQVVAEVTALDISPHGSHVLVEFGNGIVM